MGKESEKKKKWICVCVFVCVYLNHFAVHLKLKQHCKSTPWDFPGKSSGVDCHFLLQGIFRTQESNLVFRIAGRRFTIWATREAHKSTILQLKNTTCDMIEDFSHCFRCISSSVQFSRSVVSNSLRPQELQQARTPCPSPTPGVYPNSYPLSRWCHPTISSSVVPSSSRHQSFPASGYFQMSQLFASGGQSIGVSDSTSVLPVEGDLRSSIY